FRILLFPLAQVHLVGLARLDGDLPHARDLRVAVGLPGDLECADVTLRRRLHSGLEFPLRALLADRRFVDDQHRLVVRNGNGETDRRGGALGLRCDHLADTDTRHETEDHQAGERQPARAQIRSKFHEWNLGGRWMALPAAVADHAIISWTTLPCT